MKSALKICKLVVIGVALLLPFSIASQTIKVASVGDSVTFGAGIEDKEADSYPQQLQQLLGSNYNVGNFGYFGATMLKCGDIKEVFK